MVYNNCILFTEYTKSLRNNDNRNGNPKGAYFCTHHKKVWNKYCRPTDVWRPSLGRREHDIHLSLRRSRRIFSRHALLPEPLYPSSRDLKAQIDKSILQDYSFISIWHLHTPLTNSFMAHTTYISIMYWLKGQVLSQIAPKLLRTRTWGIINILDKRSSQDMSCKKPPAEGQCKHR